jgi:hypothetical protein
MQMDPSPLWLGLFQLSIGRIEHIAVDGTGTIIVFTEL